MPDSATGSTAILSLAKGGAARIAEPITSGSAAKKRPRRPSSVLLRARLVLPIGSSPIPNGAVMVEGDKISAVGRWKDLRQFQRQRGSPDTRTRRNPVVVVDLGDGILMPGLVN